MLLEGLLIKDPKKRLGSLGGIREILGHPWVRKIKPADIANRTVETPIKVDLLIFNINQEEIEETENHFTEKFGDEDVDFEETFPNFYFNRHGNVQKSPTILQFTSENTKENKGSTLKYQNGKPKKNGLKSHSK
jgi:hypothetical protein